MEKIIIAAVAANNVIGKDGKMPWHVKEELQHFKRTTLSFPVIMGRKTFESFNSKPLKNRENIVITRNPEKIEQADGFVIKKSLEEAYKYCSHSGNDKIFIIGGEEIYRQAMDDCDKMFISKLKFEVEGDTYFPEIKESKWKIGSVENFNEFDVYTYLRK